jgi:hypothetical protein
MWISFYILLCKLNKSNLSPVVFKLLVDSSSRLDNCILKIDDGKHNTPKLYEKWSNKFSHVPLLLNLFGLDPTKASI